MFARVGGKSRLRDEIVERFPKHVVYVEPFVGGGSVFFAKPPSDIEIINDLDVDVFDIYRDMKNIGESMKNRDFVPSRAEFNRLKNKRVFKNPEDRLYRNLYLSLLSFSGRRDGYMGEKWETYYTEFGKKYKTDKWQNRLEKVVILNLDFKKIIQTYDSKDTFFYLDPPYSNNDSSWGYEHNVVTPNDVFNAVKSLKGKFLLSYDNSQIVRDTFRQYNIRRVKTVYKASGKRTPQFELLISNY